MNQDINESPETREEGNVDLNTDENLSGSSRLNEPVAEESELEKLRAELEEQKDKYLRLAAEFENYKRRSSKERLPCVPVLSMPTTAHLRYQRCDQLCVMDQYFAQDAADASTEHH